MKDGFPPLTPEQLKNIKDILKDLDDGAETTPHEEVVRRLKEKYGKK